MKYRIREVREKKVYPDQTFTTFTYYPEFKDIDLWFGFGIICTSFIEARKFIENKKREEITPKVTTTVFYYGVN